MVLCSGGPAVVPFGIEGVSELADHLKGLLRRGLVPRPHLMLVSKIHPRLAHPLPLAPVPEARIAAVVIICCLSSKLWVFVSGLGPRCLAELALVKRRVCFSIDEAVLVDIADGIRFALLLTLRVARASLVGTADEVAVVGLRRIVSQRRWPCAWALPG